MLVADVQGSMDCGCGCVWLSLFKVGRVFTDQRDGERAKLSHSVADRLNYNSVWHMGREYAVYSNRVGLREVEYSVLMESEYSFLVTCRDMDSGLVMGTMRGVAIKDY